MEMVFGPEMAADDIFAKSCGAFVSTFGLGAVVVGGYAPPLVRGLLGFVFRYLVNRHLDKCIDRLRPVVTRLWKALEAQLEVKFTSNMLDAFMTVSTRSLC